MIDLVTPKTTPCTVRRSGTPNTHDRSGTDLNSKVNLKGISSARNENEKDLAYYPSYLRSAKRAVQSGKQVRQSGMVLKEYNS